MDEFVFNPEEWLTPNTYDTNYKDAPESSGVYLLVRPTFNYSLQPPKFEILYVGSSKCLSQRYSKHEVLRALIKAYGYIQFYFKECQDYIEAEKKLIKQIQPQFNTQWL